MPSVTRIEIGTRPGYTDSRGLRAPGRIREHLGLSPRPRSGPATSSWSSRRSPPPRPPRVAASSPARWSARGRSAGSTTAPSTWRCRSATSPGVTDPVGEERPRRHRGPPRPRRSARERTSTPRRLYLLYGVSDGATAGRVATGAARQRGHRAGRASSPSRSGRRSPPTSVPRGWPSTRRGRSRRSSLRPRRRGARRRSRGSGSSRSRSTRCGHPRLLPAGGAGPRAPRRSGSAPQPTDVELECLAQTWSEHCKHKIFNATITYAEEGEPPEEIRLDLQDVHPGHHQRGRAADRGARGEELAASRSSTTTPASSRPPTRYHLVYKVETHNSPRRSTRTAAPSPASSGVNRDPFGTGLGADLLSNVWGYCFGPPDCDGPLPAAAAPPAPHPRRRPRGRHRRRQPVRHPLRRAAGSSSTSASSASRSSTAARSGACRSTIAGAPGAREGGPARRPHRHGGRPHRQGRHPRRHLLLGRAAPRRRPVQAVQIGDPITQKMMFDFLLEARDRGLYSAITDNGAGGLSSSVGEMAQAAGRRAARPRAGAAQVPGARAVGDPGLRGAGAHDAGGAAGEARRASSTLARLPRGRGHRPRRVHRRAAASTCSTATQTVALLPHGVPPRGRSRSCGSTPSGRRRRPRQAPATPAPRPGRGTRSLRDFLAPRQPRAPTRSSRRTYDHEVKGLTVVKPWIGARRDVPSDASVFHVAHDGDPTRLRARRGGLPDLLRRRRPRHGAGRRGPRRPARHRRRRAASTGSPRLDNYCWPDPLRAARRTPTPRTRWRSSSAPRAASPRSACAYGVAAHLAARTR